MRFPLVFGLLLVTASAQARPDRPNQIPNGTKNRCQNCHLSASGGDLRNEFGATIEAGGFLLPDATVNWGPALAALDSDHDGRSNGEELQDPTGSWRRGMPAPGNLAAVTNPGVPDSPRVPASNVWSRAGLFIALALAIGARRLRRTS